jgi:hypothetical protein
MYHREWGTDVEGVRTRVEDELRDRKNGDYCMTFFRFILFT